MKNLFISIILVQQQSQCDNLQPHSGQSYNSQMKVHV